ncbi:hypothetical protein [Chromobacterium violaceum]|uniref:Uncharacterized protein n=1 Tax=Chromobacterium violaceum TaxID=536 RepID=A0A202BCZ0_CHRVL|nr:hypothetical protein [Chromobacterium violaceum]OVE49423.1 hypothetical protein CBW21_05945 [Chromobacterium violaceum]
MIQGRVLFVDDEDMLAEPGGKLPSLYDLKPDILSTSAEFDLVIYQGARSRGYEVVIKSRLGVHGHIEPAYNQSQTVSPHSIFA